jgi:hypothetical protein
MLLMQKIIKEEDNEADGSFGEAPLQALWENRVQYVLEQPEEAFQKRPKLPQGVRHLRLPDIQLPCGKRALWDTLQAKADLGDHEQQDRYDCGRD